MPASGITDLAAQSGRSNTSKSFAWRRKDVVAWFTAHPLVAVLTTTMSVGLFLVSYHINIGKPAEARAKVEAEVRAVASMRVAQSVTGAALEGCLDKAEAEAKARWNAQCRREGKRGDCYLSAKRTQTLQREAGAARNACLLKYSLAQ